MEQAHLPTDTRTATTRAPRCGTRDKFYRTRLRINGIQLHQPLEEPPQDIQALLGDILPHGPITITGKAAEIIDTSLTTMDEDLKAEVEYWFYLFIEGRIDKSRLTIVSNKLLNRLGVPNKPGQLKIATPKPDLHLGYKHEWFDNGLQGLLGDFDKNSAKFAFLDVELIGRDESGPGRLWMATNRCMGAASTLLNIPDKLRSALHENGLVEEANALDPLVFSVISDRSVARLFATYSDGEGNFTTYWVKDFLLNNAPCTAKLDAYIQHIIDWGMNKRLQTIKSALQALRESRVRGDVPALPAVSSNRGIEKEPKQARSKKRVAETQPSTRKRAKLPETENK
ncbi:unnamed protein product [Clonostachys rosea]|uniref:DUF7924 domain-containing protein n=1 Tax=Bionectria ochroleuca TaxID=29856 RepID=A0ABY6V0P2_BIOOC|nr:unnamed protein product [Clonostachys rosea]